MKSDQELSQSLELERLITIEKASEIVGSLRRLIPQTLRPPDSPHHTEENRRAGARSPHRRLSINKSGPGLAPGPLKGSNVNNTNT